MLLISNLKLACKGVSPNNRQLEFSEKFGSDLSKLLQQRALSGSEGFLEGLSDDFYPAILAST
jgi:hypothetical protein